MTTSRDLLQQALEFIEDGYHGCIEVKANLRAAIKAMEDAEPVAYVVEAAWGSTLEFDKPDFGKAEWKAPEPKITPLYTHPAPADCNAEYVRGREDGWDAAVAEVEETKRRLVRQSEVHAAEKKMLQARLDALLDPIVRAKMLEPPPPILMQSPAVPSQEPAPVGATHYQPHQKTYYKRVSATEWFLWSCTGKGWIESKGTSDSADWVMLNPITTPAPAVLELANVRAELKATKKELNSFKVIVETRE